MERVRQKSSPVIGLRKIVPICLAVALIRFLLGRFRLSGEYLGMELSADNQVFRPFRYIVDCKAEPTGSACVFSVSFRFARLTERQNRWASILPMLLIAGFPGFRRKIYSSDSTTGHWMGLYEWESQNHLDEYRRSLVYCMMKLRARPETIVEKYYNEQDFDWMLHSLSRN